MDYKKLAKDILLNVGGESNVASVTHCATRLRFNLRDESKANKDILKDTKGVMGVVSKGGQFQVIIGSDVQSVYKQLLELGTFDSNTSTSEVEGEKKGPVAKVLDTIAGMFTPIIPAITGAGMLKAVLALLVAAKRIDTAGQTYQILNFMSDAAFYFLPFLLANSAAKKFKCNPYMAMTIAAILLHPTFTAMKSAGESVQFLGLPVTLASYSSSVIPIILSVWFMSYVEPVADKISPKAIKFFTKPLITMVVTGIAALIVIGPIGTICGDGIAFGVSFLAGLVLYKDKAKKSEVVKEEKAVEVTAVQGTITEEFQKSNGTVITAPITGKAISLSQVEDPTFAEEILGKGIAIDPTIGEVYAPVDGEILTVFDTKHAYGIKGDNGCEVLIHIGIDTVKLGGEYFTAHVKDGDRVKQGDLIATFDMENIQKAGYSTVTPVIVSNTGDYTDILGLIDRDVNANDQVIKAV